MRTPMIIKEAVDEGKAPGFWAQQGVLNRVRREDEVKKRWRKSNLYTTTGGMGVGGTIGFLLAATSKGALKKIPAVIGGMALGSVASVIPKIFAEDKIFRDYLKEKGIETGSTSGKIKGMTEEAKKKYLHKKYVGGGYEKGIPTIT